ncbi:Phage major capsid protein [Rhodovulum sp. PH10]|uniref:phage major capsid protein n=1 Tax=Rhodovulum sp. PH10 TaxID=1187851 RepID=UPI00027C24B3|nr:phage major capsid protein [Rhodovulum sp. PH10]EJW12741.1 Phage major capsid protein [Rhodovulum sp. PH10]
MGVNLPIRARGLVRAPRADASQADAVKILAELKTTVEAFKAEHEAEIKAIKKGMGDVVQTEKVDRINAEITKLQTALDKVNAALAAVRAGAGGDKPVITAERRAHAAAFDRFFRRGADAGLRDLEIKAELRTDSDPDGGYVVPEQMEAGIDRVLGTISVMRQIARVVPVSTGTYKRLINQGGAGYGWVGERQMRPETGTPTLAELAYGVMEMYANPAATQTLLDDATTDIEQWLAAEVSTVFAEQEGAAFIAGDGVMRPRGLLSYDTVTNAAYTWGKLGYVATGVAAALSDATHNGVDALIDVYYALKSGYRNGAAWLMSDAVMGAVRKLKDGDGNYIWAPPSATAELGTVLGKPVYTDDNMPAIGANAVPIAFGNFQRGYLIVDRIGVRVLRDPYTNKPYVHFYTTKRVGGGVQNFEAIKLLKCAAN